MFHRTLFNYLLSVNCANSEPDKTEAFFNSNSEYIIAEYFRLLMAHESEHESVDLLSYEYAKLLTLIKGFMDTKDTGKIHDLILRHRFNTSHLFCVVNELELESLATGQSYNYCWTIDNNATSTSTDIMRCFVDDVISSESVIAADAEQECVDRLTSHTEMIAVGHQKYRFVYGHESDKGSALVFRAFTDIGNDKYVSNGYVWIDNYTAKANEFMGLRARDWYRSVYSGLAQNSAGDYDYAAYMVDFENKISVEYASGEMVETRLQYLENVSLLPSFEANNDTLYFVDEYASTHISALRVDDYVALAMFKRNEALTLGLLSPNGDIISATKEGDIFNDLLINMVELKK